MQTSHSFRTNIFYKQSRFDATLPQSYHCLELFVPLLWTVWAPNTSEHTRSKLSFSTFLWLWLGPLFTNCLPWSACGPARPTLQASEVACIYIHPNGHQHSELAQISAPRYPKTELSVRSRTSSHGNAAIHELHGTQHERFAKYLCPLRTDRNARSTSTMAGLRLCVCVRHSFSSVHMWGSY